MVTMSGMAPTTPNDRTPPTSNGTTNNNIATIASALASLIHNKTRSPEPAVKDAPAPPLQPLYTIEQIELVRRLKNSGMTKEQLIMAYDSFDRLEQDLGHVYTVPVTFAQQMPQLAMQPLMAQMMGQNTMGAQALAAFTAAQETLAQQLQVQQSQQASLARKRSMDVIPDSIDTELAATPAKQQNGLSHAPTTPHIASPQSQSINMGYSSHGPGNTELDDVESTDEYKDFVKKGEPHCCEEIRSFVLRFNIKQQQIAILAGISQSYVSRYFKGDFHDMSERSRRAIQKWYIMFHKNPAAIGPAANAMMLNNSPQFPGVKKFVEVNPSGDFTSYPRRERFVFRPTHLEVLESFFNSDSYPSQEKRDEIARVCNGSLDLGGRQLTERETVTPQVVANWFANKRKEVKKLAKEEGIDPSHMYLKGRGRPSRFGHVISDFQSHSRMSPESSNSDSDIPSQVVLSTSHHRENTSDDTHEETVDLLSATQPMYHDKEFNGENHGNDQLLSKNMDNEGHLGNGGGSEVSDEQNLSLAVEMAAVNQAILSLSGQNPINVKNEKLESLFP